MAPPTHPTQAQVDAVNQAKVLEMTERWLDDDPAGLREQACQTYPGFTLGFAQSPHLTHVIDNGLPISHALQNALRIGELAPSPPQLIWMAKAGNINRLPLSAKTGLPHPLAWQAITCLQPCQRPTDEKSWQSFHDSLAISARLALIHQPPLPAGQTRHEGLYESFRKNFPTVYRGHDSEKTPTALHQTWHHTTLPIAVATIHRQATARRDDITPIQTLRLGYRLAQQIVADWKQGDWTQSMSANAKNLSGLHAPTWVRAKDLPWETPIRQFPQTLPARIMELHQPGLSTPSALALVPLRSTEMMRQIADGMLNCLERRQFRYVFNPETPNQQVVFGINYPFTNKLLSLTPEQVEAMVLRDLKRNRETDTFTLGYVAWNKDKGYVVELRGSHNVALEQCYTDAYLAYLRELRNAGQLPLAEPGKNPNFEALGALPPLQHPVERWLGFNPTDYTQFSTFLSTAAWFLNDKDITYGSRDGLIQGLRLIPRANTLLNENTRPQPSFFQRLTNASR